MSHFRKCGDADDKDHNISFSDAIKLDVLLQQRKLGTPLLDYFNLKLQSELRKINEYESISNVLINIGGRIGNLMDITQEAIKPSGPKGSVITKEEKQKIFKAVSEFEEKIAKEFGKKFGVFVNSGSSACLLALAALDLPKGSKIITPALTFSTTLAPIIQFFPI